MQTRQVTELDSGETGKRLSDLRNTTFEGGDGHSFRFKTNTVLNGSASTSVDGTAESGADALKVKLKEPKRDQYTENGSVLFPTLHMRRMIEAAQAGETTMSARVFDGSDDGRKIFDTLAVIGKPITAEEPAKDGGADRDKPLRDGEMAAMRRWPVTLSYFTPDRVSAPRSTPSPSSSTRTASAAGSASITATSPSPATQPSRPPQGRCKN